MDIDQRIQALEGLCEKLTEENKQLARRVSELESQLNRSGDKRNTQNAKRVMGFTLSNVHGYYNAVRTIEKTQVRVYIGKDISNEDMLKQKITEHLVKNAKKIKGLGNTELIDIPQVNAALSFSENKTQPSNVSKPNPSKTSKKIYGARISSNKDSNGYDRTLARLNMEGKTYNIYLAKGWDIEKLKELMVSYLLDHKEALESYKKIYPEYAKELGLTHI